MTISTSHYVALATLLFSVGFCGVALNRKNIIVLLMSIELMLLAANINFVAFSSFYGNVAGQVFTIFIFTVAAAEAAIGLAILVSIYRNRRSIGVDAMNRLKG
ncbi:MAG: NADH-quinone oxidoreductase subunit NuoK [Rickettsiales bacterium]